LASIIPPALVRTFAPLLLVPVSLALHYTNVVASVWVFLAGLTAIAVLADWVRRGTEQVAEHAGGAIGSLLNVSFGNAAELVLALFVLAKAQTEIVQAQITGSIIGTTLLFLGVSALLGGVKRPRQTFSQERVGLLSTLMMLVAIAILLRAVFRLDRARIVASCESCRSRRAAKPCGVGGTAVAVCGTPHLRLRHPSQHFHQRGRTRRRRVEPAEGHPGDARRHAGDCRTIADLFASVAFARADRMEISSPCVWVRRCRSRRWSRQCWCWCRGGSAIR